MASMHPSSYLATKCKTKRGQLCRVGLVVSTFAMSSGGGQPSVLAVVAGSGATGTTLQHNKASAVVERSSASAIHFVMSLRPAFVNCILRARATEGQALCGVERPLPSDRECPCAVEKQPSPSVQLTLESGRTVADLAKPLQPKISALNLQRFSSLAKPSRQEYG